MENEINELKRRIDNIEEGLEIVKEELMILRGCINRNRTVLETELLLLEGIIRRLKMENEMVNDY